MEQRIRFCTSSDGVKLAYAVTGEGPPLVMSATWLTHLEHQWRSLTWKPWLEALSRDHSCCATIHAAADFPTTTPTTCRSKPGSRILKR